MMLTLFDTFMLAQRNDSGITLQGFLLMAGIIIAGFVGLICLIVLFSFGSLWLQAQMSGADVSMGSLIGMYFRQVRSSIVVNAKIMAAQAGLDIDRKTGISTQRLEAHYLAEGNVMNVLNAIIAVGVGRHYISAAGVGTALPSCVVCWSRRMWVWFVWLC